MLSIWFKRQQKRKDKLDGLSAHLDLILSHKIINNIWPGHGQSLTFLGVTPIVEGLDGV